MKRNLSDSDCDDDDMYDDKGTPSQSNDSCQMLNRKKRRGIIEKRRRDRINSSLTELRRLVPTAFEKQGSAKLEKAEILQMTVDHLKMLHAKGFDALSFDPHKFAMDYHSIGFRECAAEVARYLVTIEGMDVQDPLRLRLMSHLQCYSAQRELASKQPHTASWGSYSSSSYPPPHPSEQQQHNPSHPPSSHPPPALLTTPCSEGPTRAMPPPDMSMRLPSSNIGPPSMSNSSSGQSPSGGMMLHHQHHQQQYHHPVSLNISTHCFGANGASPQNPYSPTSGSQTGPKPYRPWGTELAY